MVAGLYLKVGAEIGDGCRMAVGSWVVAGARGNDELEAGCRRQRHGGNEKWGSDGLKNVQSVWCQVRATGAGVREVMVQVARSFRGRPWQRHPLFW